MTLSTEQIDELRRYVRRNIAIPKKYMSALLDTAEREQTVRELLGFGTAQDAGYNLHGALDDLKKGKCDATVLETIEKAIAQIARTRTALNGSE